MRWLRWFHRHNYSVRETAPGGQKVLACYCGAHVPLIRRDAPPKFEALKPAHERLTVARRPK